MALTQPKEWRIRQQRRKPSTANSVLKTGLEMIITCFILGDGPAMALQFFSKFTAIGSSTLQSLTEQIHFEKPIVKKGATLVLPTKNIFKEIIDHVKNTKYLLIFIGGNDATDDGAVKIRPVDTRTLLIDGFSTILKVRAFSKYRNYPLVFILLLPRHIASCPGISKKLRILNKKIKQITQKTKAEHKTNITYIDPHPALASPAKAKQNFTRDEKHLTFLGGQRLIASLFKNTEHLR